MFGNLFNRRAEDQKLSEQLLGAPTRRILPSDFIRVVVFQNVAGSEHKVPLYDSKATLQPQQTRKTSRRPVAQQRHTGDHSRQQVQQQQQKLSQQQQQQQRRPQQAKFRVNNDIVMLGEMIFGTIPMSFKGSTIKLHVFKPPALMISQLLLIKESDYQKHILARSKMAVPGSSTSFHFKTNQQQQQPNNKSYSYQNVANDQAIAKKNAQQDLKASITSKTSTENNHGFEFTVSDFTTDADMKSDSGVRTRSNTINSLISLGAINPQQSTDTVASDITSQLSFEASSSFTKLSPSMGFKQRRLKRSSSTNIEHGHFRTTPEFETDTLNTRQRKKTYSISVIFSLNGTQTENIALQEFLFSHFSLIEFKLSRLYHALLESLVDFHIQTCQETRHEDCLDVAPLSVLHLNSCPFFQKAFSEFKENIAELYCVPRLQNPVWLDLVTFPQTKHEVASLMLEQMMYLLENYDTKSNNFFLSTLLTSVLMHHLGWVPTVVPISDMDDSDHLNKHVSVSLQEECQKLSYNPLWAQLGDIYGSIGSPSSLSRTVVCGQRGIASRFLYILSYFIRCNEIFENVVQVGRDFLLEEDLIKKENFDILDIQNKDGVSEMNMPKSNLVKMIPEIVDDMENIKELKEKLLSKSLGRSLLGNYLPKYQPDFALVATEKFDFEEKLSQDLCWAVQQSILDEPLEVASCIIADTNNRTVTVLSTFEKETGVYLPWSTENLKYLQKVRIRPSESLKENLRSMKELFYLGLPVEACLAHIEDCLRDLYLKSKVLAEFVVNNQQTIPFQLHHISRSLRMDPSDIRLLVAIAGTHCALVKEDIIVSY